MTKIAQIKEEYIVSKGGKSFVLADGLSEAASRTFATYSVQLEVIQIGNASNDQTWVVKAIVSCENGIFEALGDASPTNVGPAMKTVLPRLADTRAKSRALKLALGAGALAIFDDPDEDDDARAQNSAQDTRARLNARDRAQAEPAVFTDPPRPIQRAQQTDPPAPRPPSAGPSTMPASIATTQQVETIYRLGETRHRLDRSALEVDCRLRFGGVIPTGLTTVQAGAYIKQLQLQELSR